MELAHVIVSMVNGRPAKVECKTCRSVHRFKTSGNSAAGPRTRNTVPKTVIRASELWEQKMATKSKEDVQAYKPTLSYQSGQVLQHPTFGLGVVEKVHAANKIAVFFRDGEKLLVQGLA